jgi:outer membrane protein assembly factor BamB
LQWSKPASGSVGLAGNDQLIYGAEADGTLIAWRRTDGERVWSFEQLRYRNLTAPLVLTGKALVVGDATGLLHFLSLENGSPMTRLSTDGSPIVAAPVWTGDTLVVVTRNGNIFGFRPE